MAEERSEEVVTIAQLIHALDCIREWTIVVKRGLEIIEKGNPVTPESIVGQPVTIRERGPLCQAPLPLTWIPSLKREDWT